MSGAGNPASVTVRCSAADMAWPNSFSGRAAAKRVLPCAVMAPTSRRTCCRGVIPRVHTPGWAWAGSLVKARTGTPAAWAGPAAPEVSAAVSGPMMMPGAGSNRGLGGGGGPGGGAAGIVDIQLRRTRDGQRHLGGTYQCLAALGIRPAQRRQYGDAPARRHRGR